MAKSATEQQMIEAMRALETDLQQRLGAYEEALRQLSERLDAASNASATQSGSQDQTLIKTREKLIARSKDTARESELNPDKSLCARCKRALWKGSVDNQGKLTISGKCTAFQEEIMDPVPLCDASDLLW